MIPAVNAVVGSGRVFCKASYSVQPSNSWRSDNARGIRQVHHETSTPHLVLKIGLGVFLCRITPADQFDAEQFVEPSPSVGRSLSFQAEPAVSPVPALFGHRRTSDLLVRITHQSGRRRQRRIFGVIPSFVTACAPALPRLICPTRRLAIFVSGT